MVFQGYDSAFQWEITLMTWMQANFPAPLINVISIFSSFGEEIFLIAVLAFLYFCWDKEYGRKVGLTISCGMIVNPMLKNLAFRRRPYFDHEGIECLRPVDSDADLYDIAAQGYSFPSGHSTNVSAVCSSVAMFGDKKRKLHAIVSAVLCLLVGFSRVVVGCHYPTDVICGWLLGLIVMLLVSFIYKKVSNPWVLTAIFGGIGLIGFFYCQTNDFFTSYGIILGLLLSIPFERKFVNFEPTRNVLKIILRMVGAIAIYFGLNTLLKLPFSKELLESGTVIAHLIRTLRYCIVIFVDLGVYPILFRGDNK